MNEVATSLIKRKKENQRYLSFNKCFGLNILGVEKPKRKFCYVPLTLPISWIHLRETLIENVFCSSFCLPSEF